MTGTFEVFRADLRAKLPILATSGSAAWDVHAFLLTETGRPNKRMIPRYNTVMIPTGIVLKPPPGFFFMVCSRSGLAKKQGLFVANAPGIIDPDYTGELMVLLHNGGYEAQYVEHEQRIAQIVLAQHHDFRCEETAIPPIPTERADGGFGSTGR